MFLTTINMKIKVKDNYTKLNRYLNIKGPKSAVYTFTPEHLPDVPWNKDKTGLQEGHGKGGNRPDLSKEARKRIALKTIAYRTGKKHTKETKRKIASKQIAMSTVQNGLKKPFKVQKGND